MNLHFAAVRTLAYMPSDIPPAMIVRDDSKGET